MVVEVFSVGFGPESCRVDKHGTKWRVAALPLGGYVKMRCDENAASVPVANSAAVQEVFQRHQFGLEWLLLLLDSLQILFLEYFCLLVFTWGLVRFFIPLLLAIVEEVRLKRQVSRQATGFCLLMRKLPTLTCYGQLSLKNQTVLLFEIERLDVIKPLTVVPRSVYSEKLRMNFGQLGVKSSEVIQKVWDI